MMSVPSSRLIKANFRRLDKLKEHYHMDFLTVYDDLFDLSSLLYSMKYLNTSEEDQRKYDKFYENYSIALKEYVVLKSTATIEYGFRNLVIFLIDSIGIDIFESHRISSLQIGISDIDRLADKKITKGLLISDQLSFKNPYLINKEISKFLKLDFHKTLASLYTLVPEEPDKDPEKFATALYLQVISDLFEIEELTEQFNTFFDQRNDIAHNAVYLKLEAEAINSLLVYCSYYLQYGTAFVLFYGIFCSDFKDYNSLSKLDYFRRDVGDSNPITIDEIKEVFELLFGGETEKLIEFIKEQQREYRKK